MKSILASKSPSICANVLNGKADVLIFKKFPKDYKGWVYIYCTNGKTLSFRWDCSQDYIFPTSREEKAMWTTLNGKVVARFWCDKVEDLHIKYGLGWETETIKGTQEIEKATCVNRYNLYDYCKGKALAIHIDNLEIFDESKELWQFKTPKNAERYRHDLEQAYKDDYEIGTRIAEGIADDDERANCVELTEMSEGYYGLTRAPKNYCYVEVE